jgi:hypothetical protein
MTDQPPLRVTQAVLVGMDSDYAGAALATLGAAVHALDLIAHDAGYQLKIEISPAEPLPPEQQM